MTVAERKEREKQQRRSDIIDAAEKRFFAKGLDGVSMDEIARDLELSKPTIYLYFKNKESLFLAVVMRGMLVLKGMFEKAVAGETTGLGKAHAFARAFFEFARDNRESYQVLTAARSPSFIASVRSGNVEGARDFGNTSLEMISLLVDAIKLGQADGTIRKDVVPLEAAIFMSMACEGAFQMTPEWEMLLKMNDLPVDRYYSHAIDVLVHGIAVEDGKK